MHNKDIAQLIRVSHDWDRAMVQNDADRIGSYMTDDWTIIGPDGRIGTRSMFLELIRSGKLTHSVMESHDIEVRVYGDAAVLIARGVSGGSHLGQDFLLNERVACLFVRQASRWLCASTHLSMLPDGDAGGV